MYRGFGTPIAAKVIRQAQQGRRDAQREIFETFQQVVLTTLLGICRDPDLARDLAQDVFLKVFAKLDQLRDINAFGGWFKQLTVNTALAYLRKHQGVSSESSDSMDWLDDSAQHSADWLSRVADIDQLMQCLSLNEQQLVWLYLVEEYSHEELAEFYALPAATIRQRYHRALKKLQRAATQGA